LLGKKRIDDFSQIMQVPEDAISGTIALYTRYSHSTFSQFYKKLTLPKVKEEEKSMAKTSSAKISSLADFTHVEIPLFSHPKKP